jgi:uncharacterized protein (TIGR02246 family)
MRVAAVLITGLVWLGSAGAARAQGNEIAAAIARDLAQRFDAACSAGDALAVADLYTEDAFVVFPGEGGVAGNREELEKLAAANCVKNSGVELELESVRARFVGTSAIVTLGRWRQRAPGPGGKPVETVVRTTELLVKSEAGWRYASDHASIGVPPPPPPATKAAR